VIDYDTEIAAEIYHSIWYTSNRKFKRTTNRECRPKSANHLSHKL